MDLENIMLSEMSQRKATTVWHHIYVQSKKVYAKQKQTDRCRKQTSGSQSGERGGGEQIRGMELRDTLYCV